MKIDIDKLIEEAVEHMEDENDLRWSVGMALQELYWTQGWAEIQERLRQLYFDKFKEINRTSS